MRTLTLATVICLLLSTAPASHCQTAAPSDLERENARLRDEIKRLQVQVHDLQQKLRAQKPTTQPRPFEFRLNPYGAIPTPPKTYRGPLPLFPEPPKEPGERRE